MKGKFVCLIILGHLSASLGTQVNIDTSNYIHVTDDHYVSFNLDTGIFSDPNRWKTFNNTSDRLGMLLACFSPAILRVGGSSADWTVFDSNLGVLKNVSLQLPDQVQVMNQQDWLNLNWLVRGTGLRVMFNLNLQLRFGVQWDPTNAAALMDFSTLAEVGESVDWQMGNEPNEFGKNKGSVAISPDQIAKDFVMLRNLNKQYDWFKMSKIVGPDVVGTFTPNTVEGKILKSVADIAGKHIDALTIHHYYFRGDVASVNDYLNPDHFGNLEMTINDVKNIIKNSSNPDLKFWITETADAWHEGTKDVSDRFVSGFLWLDKLGLAASMGVGAVMRQTFFGHYYALVSVDENGLYFPNPDYWLTLQFSRFVGHKVLNVTTSSSRPKTTRVYAHCTNLKYMFPKPYPVGSVTMFALNMNRNTSDTLKVSKAMMDQPVDIYLFTPGDSNGMLSKHVMINGKLMEIEGDHKMPFVIEPKKGQAKDGIELPPLTFGFFIFPQAGVKFCT